MTKESFHRRTFVRSVIFAAMVELLLLGWSLYEMGIGGLEGGGRVFAALHVPSSIFFGVLFSWMLNSNASMALQILFAAMVSVSQVVILSSLLYWAAEFLRKIR